MFEIEETVAIQAPIERVWGFVMDESNSALWQTTLSGVECLTDGPLDVGSRVRESRRFLGRTIDTVWEMTACEAPSSSSIRSVEAPFAWEGTYRLERVDGGTRFTLRLKGDPGGFFKMAEPLVSRMTRRELAGNVANLKDVLEAGVDAAPARVEEGAVRS